MDFLLHHGLVEPTKVWRRSIHERFIQLISANFTPSVERLLRCAYFEIIAPSPSRLSDTNVDFKCCWTRFGVEETAWLQKLAIWLVWRKCIHRKHCESSGFGGRHSNSATELHTLDRDAGDDRDRRDFQLQVQDSPNFFSPFSTINFHICYMH
jgi:hypothetical protein